MAGQYSYPSLDHRKELWMTAYALVASEKGILAADDPIEDFGIKLKSVGLDNTLQNRTTCHELLFTTEKIDQYISGVILTEEELHQKTANGETYVDLLKRRRVLVGINIDKGLTSIDSTGEWSTQGLDGLGARCAQYKKDGVQFAKWRCVIKISTHTPSTLAIKEISTVLARYAAMCQMYRLVPIIEPEVIVEGDHDIEQCQKVTETVLSFVYEALRIHNVYLEGTVLVMNMVTPGTRARKATHVDIAKATVTALQRTCPAVVPGVCFLSGAQTDEEATSNLNAIVKESDSRIGPRSEKKTPWKLTFCFGQALQSNAWKVWQGKSQNAKVTQQEFLKRVEANSLASLGKYH